MLQQVVVPSSQNRDPFVSREGNPPPRPPPIVTLKIAIKSTVCDVKSIWTVSWPFWHRVRWWSGTTCYWTRKVMRELDTLLVQYCLVINGVSVTWHYRASLPTKATEDTLPTTTHLAPRWHYEMVGPAPQPGSRLWRVIATEWYLVCFVAVCNKWYHERGNEFTRPCALEPNLWFFKLEETAAWSVVILWQLSFILGKSGGPWHAEQQWWQMTRNKKKKKKKKLNETDGKYCSCEHTGRYFIPFVPLYVKQFCT